MAIGDLVANLTANTSGFSRGLNNARGMLGSFAGGVTNTLGRIGLAFQGLSAIKSIGSGAGEFLKLAADAEQTKIAFEVMTGSGEAANTMLAQMRDFASTTPLDTASLQESGKTLLQFGIDGGQVMPILRMLGDVSGGNAEKMKGMAVVFGQMSATGRLMGGDLLQFINQGFNPLQEISRHTGESMVSLKKKMEDGGISADMVAESFQRATSEGGQFNGMLQRQGQTAAGMFGQLQDGVALAMTDIGQALIEGFDLKGLMGEANSFLDVFRSTWMPGITTTINTVGQAFQRVIAFMRTGWGDWITSTFTSLVDFGANFDIYWQVAQQNIVLFAANGINSFDNFFNNIKQWMGWLGTAWMSLMEGLVTSVVEMATRATGTLTSIATGAASGGITGAAAAAVGEFGKSAALSGAFDPFAESLADLPKLTTAAIAETSPELEALYQQLADRQAAAASKTVTQAAVVPAEEALKLTGKAPAAKKSDERAALSIATKGSQEASKAINLALRGEKEKAAEQTADNTEKTAEEVAAHTSILNDIRDNSRGSMTPVVVSFA